MARREFKTAVRVAVITRATHNSVIYCEQCHGIAKKFQIDHIIPDSQGGEPTLENAQLLCESCYNVKNPEDTSNTAKAKRREANHKGATRPKTPIKSRGFAPSDKPAPKIAKQPVQGLSEIARRYVHGDQ
jgi:hypothetical protein